MQVSELIGLLQIDVREVLHEKIYLPIFTNIDTLQEKCK